LVDRPDVSVIVIAYNDALRLPRAVESALTQTHRAVEVIIVDDCSTDETSGVAQDLAARHPDRVRAYSLETNSGGCSRPRNVGIEHARGEFVMLLDSDDELDRPMGAAAQQRVMAYSPDAVMERRQHVFELVYR